MFSTGEKIKGGHFMFRIKNFLFVFSVFLIMGVITACSGGDSASSSETNKAEGSDQVTLEIWDFMQGRDAYINVIEKFNEEHEDIQIKRTEITRSNFDSKMINAAAANELPDLFVNSHSRFQAFADAGIAANISDMINESGLDQKFFEGSLEPQIFKGDYYGLPLYNNDLALYYNKEMFEKAGLDSPPETWEDIRDYANKLTNDNVYGLAMAGSKDEQGTFNFLPWIWQAGADLDTLSSEEGVNAIEFRQTLLEDGSVSKEMLNWQQNDANLQFLSEQAAMQINGSWNVPTLNKEAEFEWAVAELPKGKQRATIIGGEAIGIGSTSKHKEEAFEFMKFFYDEETYKSFILEDGNLPSIKAIAEAPEIVNDPNMKVFTKGLEYAKSRAYGPNYPEISAVVQELVQATVLGKDAEKIAKEAEKEIKPLLMTE